MGTLGIISFLSAGLGTEWLMVSCRLVWLMLDVGYLDGNTMDESRCKFYKKCQCRMLKNLSNAIFSLMSNRNFVILWAMAQNS